jgi:hypothetical protein
VNAANASTIRIAPALTIGDVEIAEFTDLFTAALAEVAPPLTETRMTRHLLRDDDLTRPSRPRSSTSRSS